MGPYWNYNNWNNSVPGSYQPFPGIYGSGIPSPPVWMPPASAPVPSQDAYQPQQPDSEQGGEKKSAWATFGKEALKTGITIGASVLGGIFGGFPGAVAAGALTSGVVSAIDQQASKGKVDWGSVAIDTVLGTIPGGVGTAVVRTAEKGLAKLAARQYVKQTGERSLKRAAAEGAADGALMGYVGSALQSGYKDYQKTGHVNFGKASQDGLKDILPGMLGGVVAGSLFTAVGRRWKQNREAKQYAASVQEPVPDHLKALQPPKVTFANRMAGMFLLKKSEDPLLGNFRRVDDHVFRGGMPESPAAFHRLRNVHDVRTIIDLRGLETTRPQHIEFEKAWAKQHGIQHVWIPLSSTEAPSQASLQRFFHELEKTRQAGGKVFVHCKHGIDRTGSFMAAYDVSRGLHPDVAYEAMRKNGYNFMHARSRPAQKAFVLQQDLRETVRVAQAGVQVRNEAEQLLRKNMLHQDELAKISDLLNAGNITEAEKLLTAKVPDRKTVFVPKAVDPSVSTGNSQGDQFTKSTSVSASSKSGSEPVTVKPQTKKTPTSSPTVIPLKKKTDGGKKTSDDTGTAASSKAATTTGTATARVMTIDELFGRNIANVHFRQNGNNTCYLLASLDGILRHPQGRRILDKIGFEKTATGYNVSFPGQPRAIAVSERDLALGGVSSNSLGIRLIERAYLKIPEVEAGAFDQPTRALERIFGWRMNQSESISLHSDPQARQFMGGVEFGYDERRAQLQQYLNQRGRLGRETGHTDADIITAISKHGGNHYYSVRFHASTPDKIVMSNPYNTRSTMEPINLDQLLRDYHLEGIRLPLN